MGLSYLKIEQHLIEHAILKQNIVIDLGTDFLKLDCSNDPLTENLAISKALHVAGVTSLGIGAIEIKPLAGTTGSAYIQRESDGSGGMSLNAGSGFSGFGLGTYWNGTQWKVLTAGLLLYYKSTTEGVIYSGAGLTPGDTWDAGADTVRSKINLANGAHGFGIASPAKFIDINKSSASGTFNAAGAPALRVINNSTATHSFAGIEVAGNNAGTNFIINTDGLGGGAITGERSAYLGMSTNHPLWLITNNTKRVQLAADGTFNIPFDNQSLTMGTANDSSIQFDGTNLIIKPDEVGTGHLLITTGQQQAFFAQVLDAETLTTPAIATFVHNTSGTAAIGFGGAVNFMGETPAGNNLAYGKFLWEATNLTSKSESSRFSFRVITNNSSTTPLLLEGIDYKNQNDNGKAYFGEADDASIYYDGTNMIINTSEVAASDLKLTTGAQKTLELQNTVYKDLQFQVSSARTNPANVAPTWETFTATTSEYAFSVNDEVDTYANEIPHWWKQGTTGHAHIHITTKGVPAQEQKAQFTVTFAYADTNEVWVEAPLTAELTIPISTTALTNFYLDLGDLTLTNYLIGAQIRCRVKRVAKSAGGTEYVGDIFITQVGIHLEADTMGSRQITTK